MKKYDRRRVLGSILALLPLTALAGCGDSSNSGAPNATNGGQPSLPPTAARPEIQAGQEKAPMPGGGPPGSPK